MVHCCSVFGCTSRQSVDRVKLHRIPTVPVTRREAWVNAIRGVTVVDGSAPWQPSTSSRVCSRHFIEGKPNDDPHHPDYVPSQRLGCSRSKAKENAAVEGLILLSSEAPAPSPDVGKPNDENDAVEALILLSSEAPNPDVVTQTEADDNDDCNHAAVSGSHLTNFVRQAQEDADNLCQVLHNSINKVPNPPPQMFQEMDRAVLSDITTSCSNFANSGQVNQTPRKIMLRKRIKQLTSHRWKMSRKIETLRSTIRAQRAGKSKLQTIRDIVAAAEPFMSTMQLSLFQAQLMNSQRCRKGMRWSTTNKLFCLQLYYKSPSAYKFARKCLALPSVSTLCSFVRGAVGRIDEGFSDVLLQLIALRIKHLPERDRQCSLVFDEMSLKSHLAYDKHTDRIVGYTADGKRATHVLVFMIRGLSMKWKQAVSFHFTHNTVAAALLAEFIIKTVQQLHNIGLSVRCAVCDQASTNISALKLLGFDCDHPQIHCHGVAHAVSVVFDVPHLLKNVRNNLQKYSIKVDDSVASWKDIEAVYSMDKLCQIRLAPRLSDRHLEPSNLAKMRVRLAAQTLSHSVAAAVSVRILTKQLPQSAQGTADFVEKMDTVFDILNSRSLVGDKPARCALTNKNDLLNQLDVLKEWISKWHFVGARGQLKSHWGLQATISSITALSCDLLREGYKFVCTSRFNQDCIENFFACMRSRNGWCENPTPCHFITAFRSQVILSSLDSTSSGKNCIADDDFQLIKPADVSHDTQVDDECAVSNESILQSAGDQDSMWDDFSNEILNSDICYESGVIETFTESEETLLNYLSGWLARKSAICRGCQDVLSRTKDEHSYCCSREGAFASHKRYINTGSVGLIEPSTELYAAVRVMENLFRLHFDKVKQASHVAFSLYSLIQPQCDFSFLFVRHPQHALYLSEKLVKMYVTMRIFYSVKFSNREIAAGANVKASRQSGRRSEKQRKMQKVTHS